MPVCPSCQREVTSPGRFCPECGAAWPAVGTVGGATAALDVTAPDSRPSSSSSLHGRFDPGTRLGSRYRVVGLLGRGGMGEVYRADDLELSQPVALKFLPERVARNAADLARLRREVRVARSIAHPNVCRTYDIAEADGQVFVVMEYVDGEDLASVLRRLGRPTPDKALEIARQLCLGLGAAHESGVLHRDLKPANIMIDGRGRVRITDFGLAGTEEELAEEGGAAGTPGYMAPEQARSGSASAQSDIYSLGLVLYELFTGKRATGVTPQPDPSRPGSDSSVRTPSSLVGGVDPAVERVILRCLERDPARRPQSAYAVYGALPGGDPLAAAVAAGETPSPELVANAGVEGSVRPLHAGAAILFTVAALVVISALNRPLFAGLDRSPQVLSVRAEEILNQTTGAPPPRFSSQSFRYAPAPADSARGAAARPPRAPAKQFWRRWSPLPLEKADIHDPSSSLDDPPQTYPGSASVALDPTGRLIALSVVPDSVLNSAVPTAADFAGFLRAAGRDPEKAAAIPPPRFGGMHGDTTAAWRVSPAGAPETTVVAAALHGRVIELDTYAGRTALGGLGVRVHRDVVTDTSQGWVLILMLYVVPLVGSILLAIRNFRAGRVDMRGAVVVGVATAAFYLMNYLFTVNLGELGFRRVLGAVAGQAPLGHALLHGVVLALAYLAIEPYIRRLWPRVLVSWARLVSGRVRDPIVGRDVLIGCALGEFGALWDQGYQHLARHLGLMAHPAAVPPNTLDAIVSANAALATISVSAALGIFRATISFTLLVIFRFLLRSNRAAVVATVLLFSSAFVTYGERSVWLELGTNIALNSIFLAFILRYGFVVTIAALFTGLLMSLLPWTTDLSTWFAPQVVLGWAAMAALLTYGFLTAVAGRSLFRDPLSDPVGVAPRPVR
ncbi:MAG: protein kinase domain-containing protein [Bacteroidota bacterium]